jgi:hypothetical protein
MKNFKLEFKRSPGRAPRGVSYNVALVWMPDRKCYRVGSIQADGDPTLLLEMPRDVRDFLVVETVDRMPLIKMGGCVSQSDCDAQIMATFPDSKQFAKRSGNTLHLRFNQQMMGLIPGGYAFEGNAEVYLAQTTEIPGYNWALVAPDALIPCRTQLQAERLAAELHLRNGNLWHQFLVEDTKFNPSTNPLEQSEYSITVGREDSDESHTYAIDYHDIAEGFIALHAAQEHTTYSDTIEYLIVPWDMAMDTARDMITRIRDIAFSHDAEAAYVAMITDGDFDDTLDRILPLIETAIDDRRDALGPDGEVKYK